MSLLTNLISCWKFDEASGNLLDAHGSNHGTDVNTVGSASGKINGARDFELSNSEYFTIPSNSGLQIGSSDATWQLWARFESFAASGAANTLVSKRQANLPTQQIDYFLRYRGTSARFDWFVSADGTTATQTRVEATSFGAPILGAWYMIIAHYSASSNEIGIQINNGAIDTLTHMGGVFASNQPVRFGSNADVPSPSEFYDGLLDQACFWKRLLTTDERTALWNGGNGLAYPFVSGTGPLIGNSRLVRGRMVGNSILVAP